MITWMKKGNNFQIAKVQSQVVALLLHNFLLLISVVYKKSAYATIVLWTPGRQVAIFLRIYIHTLMIYCTVFLSFDTIMYETMLLTPQKNSKPSFLTKLTSPSQIFYCPPSNKNPTFPPSLPWKLDLCLVRNDSIALWQFPPLLPNPQICCISFCSLSFSNIMIALTTGGEVLVYSLRVFSWKKRTILQRCHSVWNKR